LAQECLNSHRPHIALSSLTMKLFVASLSFAQAAVALLSSSSASEEAFLRDLGDKHDAGAVMSQLQGIMGAAQMKLGIAQRHHAKVVKKIRKEASAYFEQEADVYGKYLNSYNTELSKANEILQNAVDEANAGLKKAESIPSSPNDWKDPAVEQRAKLTALISSAERTVKKNERRQSRQLREGEESAEEVLEDESQKLGMKLGDMTPVSDAAKKALEAAAEKKVDTVSAKKVEAKTDKNAKVDFQKLQDNLSKASKDVQDKTKDAGKKLDGFLSKTAKDVADKRAKIQGDLDSAQKQEIAKVLGRKPAEKTTVAKAAPAKKADAVKKVAAKVDTTKKVDTKAPVKAAPAAPAAKKVDVKPAAKVDTKAPVKAAPAAPAAKKVDVKPAAKVAKK